jgi:purine nucleosidase
MRKLLPLAPLLGVIALAALSALAAATPAAAAPRHPAPVRTVIHDHDGNADDFVALALVMRSGQFRVAAVTVTPGDAYLEPATRTSQLFLDRLGARGVPVVMGHDEGTNPFPEDWRKAAASVLDIAALKGARPSGANPVAAEDAAHYLARLLSRPGRYTILETGPLSNIAAALKLKPSIARHIERIWIMGGAVRVGGNSNEPGYEQAGSDGAAEWNIFNAPRAAAEVLASGVPITLIPLDATNKVPLTRRFVDQLGARPGAIARLSAQTWRTALPAEGQSYYFWDTLTAAAMLDPSLVTVKTLKVKVITQGPSQGRTVEAADGRPIQVAVDADAARVEALFLKLLGR